MIRKDILGIKDLSRSDITEIIRRADKMLDVVRSEGRLNDLSGKNVVTLFYENSTRTRNSFDMAAKRLGASTTSVAVATSSVQKGESLIDTGKTLDALGMDVMIIRHPVGGASRLLAENVKASVINAGDGMAEHPSQALLDVFTAWKHFSSLDGVKVVIVGDIKHSRVARSDVLAFSKLGADVTLCAPYTLLPTDISGMGARITTDFDDAIVDADIVMPLRVQKERMSQGYFSTVAEYNEYYGVNEKRLARTAADSIVMHPAPINRGVEIDGEVADGLKSVIEEQVTNGVAVRMAMLKLVTENNI